MKVFLSWSGSRSKRMAEALKIWLPDVIQAVEPWVSSQDIQKGSRGLKQIADELEGANFGIICVTEENQASEWVNFEAGALSKQISQSYVVPLLLDIEIPNLVGPLAQFQVTLSNSKEDIKKLVVDVNTALGDSAITLERLDRSFDKNWDSFDSIFNEIRQEDKHLGSQKSDRPTSEVLSELVVLMRAQERRLVDLEGMLLSIARQEWQSLIGEFEGASATAKRKDTEYAVRQDAVRQLRRERQERYDSLAEAIVREEGELSEMQVEAGYISVKLKTPPEESSGLWQYLEMKSREFNIPISVVYPGKDGAMINTQINNQKT